MDRTIQTQLAAPMNYKWRLKGVTNKAKKPYPQGTKGQFLAYIDARDVMSRLDEVMGLGNWQMTVSRVNEDGSAIVRLSLRLGDEWIHQEDCGYSNSPGAGVEEEPLKAAVSDGIKRAAIHFGIGRFLYELPPTWTEIDQNGNPLRALNGAAPAERIDREMGEISPAPSPSPRRVAAPVPETAAPIENQPCAIDGCQGVCNGSWVGFSLSRYGVPLCSKHSALAKRGEIDAELEALNAAAR